MEAHHLGALQCENGVFVVVCVVVFVFGMYQPQYRRMDVS